MDLVFSFVLVSFFALVRHTYSDVTRFLVDSKINWVAYGYLLCVCVQLGLVFDYLVWSLGFLVLFGFLNRGEWAFGDGDKEILGWLVPGLIVFGWFYVVLFGFLLVGLGHLYKTRFKKLIRAKKLPFVPLIFAVFMLVVVIYYANVEEKDSVVEFNLQNTTLTIKDTNQYPNPYCWGPKQTDCPPYKQPPVPPAEWFS